jgi:hypothetical protein
MDWKNLIPMDWRYRVMELRGRGLYNGYADRYRCVFIHIPKTAGTSVAKALFGQGSRHVPCVEYEKANPRKFACYFKFAFVRNPWSRLYSAYTFLNKGGMNEADQAWAATNLAGIDSFEQFVLEWLDAETMMSWVHFMPQHHFITNSRGEVAMDFIGRMENIDTDFNHVCQRLGIVANLPTLNKSTRHPHIQPYTDEMRNKVGELYKKDVSLFGYKFGDTI